MSGQETGKQKAARIPLDYYKRPDWLQHWKLILTGLALVIAVGWWASGLLRSDQGRLRYSRGPVAAVHATWDTECAACHESFTPMTTQSGAGSWLGRFHASDARCQTCHAGAPHSQRQIDAQVANCADCHRDHQGRDVSLISRADSDCTRCHADLKEHVASNALPPRFENVSRFAEPRGHPEFKLLRDHGTDPGKLKFNHQLHMTRDLLQKKGRRREEDIRVTLQCASCHRLADNTSSRQGGAYMLPVTYEKDCRACHALTLEPTAIAEKGGPPLTAPHGLQPDAIHQFLERSLLGRYVEDRQTPLLEEAFQPLRPRPGKAPAQPEKQMVRAAVADQVARAEGLLYLGKQTCSECHFFTTPTGAVEPRQLRPSTTPDFKVQPPAVPAVWFKHAFFDHSAHRALGCLACHPGATASTTHADILIPGITNCLQCHAPVSHSGGSLKGGARFNCTECHRYHHPDNAVPGVKTATGGPPQNLSIQQFLAGRPDSASGPPPQ